MEPFEYVVVLQAESRQHMCSRPSSGSEVYTQTGAGFETDENEAKVGRKEEFAGVGEPHPAVPLG